LCQDRINGPGRRIEAVADFSLVFHDFYLVAITAHCDCSDQNPGLRPPSLLSGNLRVTRVATVTCVSPWRFRLSAGSSGPKLSRCRKPNQIRKMRSAARKSACRRTATYYYSQPVIEGMPIGAVEGEGLVHPMPIVSHRESTSC